MTQPKLQTRTQLESISVNRVRNMIARVVELCRCDDTVNRRHADAAKVFRTLSCYRLQCHQICLNDCFSIFSIFSISKSYEQGPQSGGQLARKRVIAARKLQRSHSASLIGRLDDISVVDIVISICLVLRPDSVYQHQSNGCSFLQAYEKAAGNVSANMSFVYG
ncbi:hypothetical protein MRB53_038868 [Persea americana]|nr:hypothetical protein MRB53_038868 [Persea americana]